LHSRHRCERNITKRQSDIDGSSFVKRVPDVTKFKEKRPAY